MEISYGQMEEVLFRHFRIQPDHKKRFRSRIGQLQRLEFPVQKGAGKGAKLSYTAEHLFKLVTAFEIIGARIPAQSAKEIVNRHWQEFAVAYSLAIGQETLDGVPRRPFEYRHGSRIYSWIISRAFGDLQMSGHGPAAVGLNYANASKLIVADEPSFLGMFTRHIASRRAYLYPVMCLSDLVESVGDAAAGAGIWSFWEDDEIRGWLPERDAAEGMLRTWLMLQFDPWTPSKPLTGADLLAQHRQEDGPHLAMFAAKSGEELSEEEVEAKAELAERARRLLPLLGLPIVNALRAAPGDTVEITDDEIQEMLYLGLMEMGDEKLDFTPLAAAIQDELEQESLAEGFARSLLAKTEAKKTARARLAKGGSKRLAVAGGDGEPGGTR